MYLLLTGLQQRVCVNAVRSDEKVILKVVSGESGAAPFGVLACIMTMDEYKELREHLGLDENSKVLLFSTEGDTDPERYKNIVWEGKER